MSDLWKVLVPDFGEIDILNMVFALNGWPAIVWQNPERKALILGDYIDRGSQQVEVVRIVLAMEQTGMPLPLWEIMNSWDTCHRWLTWVVCQAK